MTVTARSEKIFQMLKTSNPVLKTLTTALQVHAQRYHECGLFAALLSTRSVAHDIMSNESMKPCLFYKIYIYIYIYIYYTVLS